MYFFNVICKATDPKDLQGTDTRDFDNVGNVIIGALKAIGTIISVAILVVLGIKYMMGSAEEKKQNTRRQ